MRVFIIVVEFAIIAVSAFVVISSYRMNRRMRRDSRRRAAELDDLVNGSWVHLNSTKGPDPEQWGDDARASRGASSEPERPLMTPRERKRAAKDLQALLRDLRD